ncbi:MAG: PqqD family protein [Wenzhouxiangella sp.]|nr:MAG: PqqD family protein [Wenzhouxiangella sp.]
MTIEAIAKGLESGRLTITSLDDGSGVVLDSDGEQLFSFNVTGLTIVQAIASGARDVEALADALTSRFEVTPERARTDVQAFLQRLAEKL